jgi:hypothetical protein
VAHATHALDQTPMVQEEWRVGGAFAIAGKKKKMGGERGHYKTFQKSNKLSKFFYLFLFHDQLSPMLSIPLS